jgi:D-alanyl-D-alanine carboxypeptidase
MRQTFLLVLAVLAAMVMAPNMAEANPKYASIVMDARTGDILRARNIDKRLHPASLTKLMTLYLTFEAVETGRLKLSTRIPMSKHAASMVPSKLGLKPGETIRVHDAIQVLVTKSANDVAVALAEAIAGSEKKFGRLMTRRARDLGMMDSRFYNASGLYHPRQRSTARDIATLGLSLMKYFPRYYGYFNVRAFQYDGKTYRNHNRLMAKYPGMDGLKTGYIRASGFNLAASAYRDGNRLIGVVFGGRSPQSRNRHMAHILDAGFRAMKPTSMQPVLASAPTPRAKPQLAVGSSDIELASNDLPVTPPQRPAAKTHVDHGGWAIQVGAFPSRAATDRAIRLATAEIPELGRHGQPQIVPLRTRNGGTLYRARLTGLQPALARAACQRLDDCLQMSPR